MSKIKNDSTEFKTYTVQELSIFCDKDLEILRDELIETGIYSSDPVQPAPDFFIEAGLILIKEDYSFDEEGKIVETFYVSHFTNKGLRLFNRYFNQEGGNYANS